MKQAKEERKEVRKNTPIIVEVDNRCLLSGVAAVQDEDDLKVRGQEKERKKERKKKESKGEK